MRTLHEIATIGLAPPTGTPATTTAIAIHSPALLRKLAAIAASPYFTVSDQMALARADPGAIAAAYEAATQALEPAGPEIINRAVEFLAAMPSATLNAADAKMVLQLYRIGLKDMPRDLLSLAAERAVRSCKWRPSPAELRALVEDELTTRQSAAVRLGRALASGNSRAHGPGACHDAR